MCASDPYLTADVLLYYRKAVQDALELLHDARYAIHSEDDASEAFALMGRVMPILLSARASEEVHFRFRGSSKDATNLTDLDF